MKKTQLAALALIIASAFSAGQVHSAIPGPIKALHHSKHKLASQVERHAYRVTLSDSYKPIILLDLTPDKYQAKDIRISRAVSSEQIYKHSYFRAAIEENARLYAMANPGTEIDFTLKSNGELNYSYRGKDPEQLRRYIEKMLKKTADITMKDIFHLKVYQGSSSYISDYQYAAITQQYIANSLTRKLSRLQKSTTDHDKLEMLLGFVQAIPYDSSSMTNVGFRTPIAVLTDHTGDCDEKSLLLSLMIKAGLPTHKTALLLSQTGKNDHAMTLIEWPYKRPGRIQIKGIYYLALETTATQPIGFIPPIMIRALKNKQYKIVSI